ncbi:MAG: heavy metal translocating P-type ATPase metal-binding domain-containing protein [Rhodospirillaceae bacterium]
MTACAHCGQPAANETNVGFCCQGCATAHELVHGLGLENYYARRSIDPMARPMRPEHSAGTIDPSIVIHHEAGGAGHPHLAQLHLMIDGIQCGACVWLIETVLSRQPGVVKARLNMTTRRLSLSWLPELADASELVGIICRLGYHALPYDPRRLGGADAEAEKELMRALAVAGFAAANVMLISVGVWAGLAEDMGPATRSLMHWFSALIAMPALAWSIRPFLRSALRALASGRTNMDVPITIGVSLTAMMSLFETINGGRHAYFDSAITLLFFLLVGRFLDRRARGRARSTAEHLLSLGAVSLTIVDECGRTMVIPPERVEVGMTVLVAAGERVPVDGRVIDGISDLDTSLITGETLPVITRPGEVVFAGTLNLTAALRVVVTAVGNATLLAEIVRLMEVAEQGRARHVALADRVSRFYAPVVHLAALSTFLGWLLVGGMAWQPALLIAVSVLIITCPCALALAVPVVQVVASDRLLRLGVLLKSATALERLAMVDTVAFDKTGTLTDGLPELLTTGINCEALTCAASLAGASRHPLARSLCRAAADAVVAVGVREVPGSGLVRDTPEGEIRLGHRRFAGVGAEGIVEAEAGAAVPELWLSRPGMAPVQFTFLDRPRPDAAQVVAQLRAMAIHVVLLSGDREVTVAALARKVGIEDHHAELDPAAKTNHLQVLAAAGRQVLMVGDGLNDAPALAAALVSMSPSSAAEISQVAADAIFQGTQLGPVVEALRVARLADRLVRQNFMLTILYNLVTVPLAVAGMVTPLIAAVSMSTSSLAVIVNSLRLGRLPKSGPD